MKQPSMTRHILLECISCLCIYVSMICIYVSVCLPACLSVCLSVDLSGLSDLLDLSDQSDLSMFKQIQLVTIVGQQRYKVMGLMVINP